MSLPVPDPETIALLQSFGYGIAQNLIASAIVEWKKLKDDRQAQDNAAWLSTVEHSKRLETRIGQNVCTAFHRLNLSREHLNLLLPLATDAVLNAELTKQIIADHYTVDSVASLVLAHQHLAAIGEAQVKSLAKLLIEAIQSAIAEDPHLCRVKQLQFEARTTEDIYDLRTEVSAGFATSHAALNRLPTELQTIVRSALKSVMAESSQEAEHLKSQNQKWFDHAREELIHGSVVVAEKEYRALVADLENQGALADRKLLFRAYANLGSSLWQQFRRDEAVAWFDKAHATKPDEQKAKTNKAVAHIHRKEFQAALDILNEVIATSPDCFEAHYLISCVHLEQDDVNRAIVVLEDRPFDSEDYSAALAQAYLRREDYPKAAGAARAALAKNGTSIEAKVMLANSLGFPLVQRRMRREILAFSLTEAERRQICEAIELGEAAVKVFRAQARSFQLGEMLTNLSAFYELAGDDERAALAAREAAQLAPQNVTALTNCWASQMRAGKYADAYDTAGQLMQCGERLVGKVRQLESLLMSSEHERLLQESGSHPDLTDKLLREPRFFELKAHALSVVAEAPS
jgi:tetratricopeptide (TPR) repeat protein